MNVNCIICSDLLTPTAEIYTTPCGHLFHYHCLIQWIERSTTCPQCRNKTTEKSIHKIYLNLSDTNSATEDVGTLQNKLDNLKFQISLKERDIKTYVDRYDGVRAKNASLRADIKELEAKTKVSESVIYALKEQISFFKQKGKECNRLDGEVTRLKEKLKDVENIQLILHGSKDEVADMLRHNRDPHSLSILVSTLKKMLVEADRKYKQISCDLKHAQTSVSCYGKEMMDFRHENNKFKNDIESHKSCAKEQQYLKRKISDLTRESPNPPKIRILDTPERLVLKDDSRMIFLDETLTVNERVKEIIKSDSPYLPVKSSNVGLSSFLKSKYSTLKPQSSLQKEPKMFNVLKQQKTDLKKPTEEYSYDGLGGHSKQEHFPSPKRLCKKLKPSATSTKAKKIVSIVKM